MSVWNPLCSYDDRVLSIGEQRLDHADQTIKEDWKALFEQYSDRILFGTDIGPGSRHEYIDEVVAYYKVVLGQLSEQAQERISHTNAASLFGTGS